MYKEGVCNIRRDWVQEELQDASKAVTATGHLGYEEFCEQLKKTILQPTTKIPVITLLKSVAHSTAKKN